MKFRRLFVACLCLISIALVAINSITNAKYYTSIITQVWKTNFTYYGVVNPGDVKFRYTIDAQSADNPSSMFDGNVALNHKEASAANDTKNRWTNWSSSGTNKGEDARVLITFVKPVYVSVIRLYHFLDNAGCDLPRDISLVYTSNTGESITVLNDEPLENLERSFEKANSRDSIFRTGDSNPIYNVNGVDKNYTSLEYYDEAPYTTIYFDEGKQVCLTSFEIHMQAGAGWYIGLTELAIDWIFADYFTNGGVLSECCSYWYGKF